MALSRRELIAGAGLAAGAAAVGARPTVAGAAAQPNVVIVGAGLAGLACADALHRNGIRAEIYEARAARIGGRCWSSTGWQHGQVAEHGGEFIDTRHTAMRGLARRFGLKLDDTWDIPGGADRLWLRGARRHLDAPDDEIATFRRRLRRLARDVGPYSYRNHTRLAREIDEMTALDMVEHYLPGGHRSVAGQAVHQFLASYLGLDLADLSGLAVIDNYVGHTAGADERYHVRGGNDQIVHALADTLPPHAITMGAALRSLHRRADGRAVMRFDHSTRPVVADHVVLALPFSTLRDVELDGARLSRHKRRCIAELGMGSNAKVILQFARRPQKYGHWSGYLASSGPYFDVWESSAGQPGVSGLLTMYFGGRSGADGLPVRAPHARAPHDVVDDVIRWIARGGRNGLPGLRAGYLGRARVDHWTRDQWTRGSYAAYLPGQYTRYAGFAGVPEGNVHFAGEHTSPLTNQGYLEGAVRTGRRAAREVLAAI